MNNSFDKPSNKKNIFEGNPIDGKVENNPFIPQGNEKPKEFKFGNNFEKNKNSFNNEEMNTSQFGRPGEQKIQGDNQFQENEKMNLNGENEFKKEEMFVFLLIY
jgi:hypothetical protein